MNTKKFKKKSDYKPIQYEFVSKLNKLCNRLDEEFSINRGGCCYVAYCLAKLLEKDDVDFSLVIFDSYCDLNGFTELIELSESMEHCAILLGDYISGDIINCEEYYFNLHYQTFKASSQEILNYYLNNYWNPTYNPSNNELIETFIKNFYYEFTSNLRKE